MGKGVEVETIDQNFKDAHSAGHKVDVFLMSGFPGETEETLQETVELIRRNQEFLEGVVHVSATGICKTSKIHDNLTKYDINPETVFKSPDVWESKDGKNNRQWRSNISERLCQTINQFGVPMADLSINGNPKFPRTEMRIPQRLKRLTPASFPKNETERSKLRSEYAAELTIKEKYFITTADQNRVLLPVHIKNTGSKRWALEEGNWVRLGCKIYNMQKDKNQVVQEPRQELPDNISRGEECDVIMRITSSSSLPKGKYRLKFDMVNERKFWFEDLGGLPLVCYIEL